MAEGLFLRSMIALVKSWEKWTATAERDSEKQSLGTQLDRQMESEYCVRTGVAPCGVKQISEALLSSAGGTTGRSKRTGTYFLLKYKVTGSNIQKLYFRMENFSKLIACPSEARGLLDLLKMLRRPFRSFL